MKKAYDISQFAMEGAELKLQTFKPKSERASCVCLNKPVRNSAMTRCVMCLQKYHGCLLQPSNTEEMCCYCISRQNDPANIVEHVLNEAFFNLNEPSMFANKLEFEFLLGMREENTRVDVRCFRAGQDGIGFPMIGTLFLNGKEVTALKPLMSNSNLKKRKDEPLTLDEGHLKGSNVLSLELPRIKRDMKDKYQVESAKTCFFLGIYVIRRLLRDEFEDYVKTKSFIVKQDSIKKFFTGGDHLIAFEGEKQSLKCPLTLEMIKVPVRGTLCSHFQVFCLRSLYATQGEKGRWMCPICKKKIFHPIMDMWVYELTSESNNVVEDERELIFQADGSYKWQKRQQPSGQPLVVSRAKPPPKRKPKKPAEADIKEEEGQVIALNPKRGNTIDLEDLQMQTNFGKDVITLDQDEPSAIRVSNNKTRESAVSNSSNATTKKKLSKQPAKKSAEVMMLSQIVEARPPKQAKKPRQVEIEDGEISVIELPKVSQPSEPKPLKTSRSQDISTSQPYPARQNPQDRLKKTLQMNQHFNKSLDVQKCEKVKETLTVTKCEDLSLHDLIKAFNKQRVRRPKKQKLFTDNFPELFKFHYH